jgi:hypothetical protein
MVNNARVKAIAELQNERRRNATQRHTTKLAHPVQRTGRIHFAVSGIAENAVAVRIENKAVKIDLQTACIAQHPVPIGVSGAVGPRIAVQFEQTLECREVITRNGKVKVGMRPCWRAEEHVDAPASVNPKAKLSRFEGATKRNDLLDLHQRFKENRFGVRDR